MVCSCVEKTSITSLCGTRREVLFTKEGIDRNMQWVYNIYKKKIAQALHQPEEKNQACCRKRLQDLFPGKFFTNALHQKRSYKCIFTNLQRARSMEASSQAIYIHILGCTPFSPLCSLFFRKVFHGLSVTRFARGLFSLSAHAKRFQKGHEKTIRREIKWPMYAYPRLCSRRYSAARARRSTT